MSTTRSRSRSDQTSTHYDYEGVVNGVTTKSQGGTSSYEGLSEYVNDCSTPRWRKSSGVVINDFYLGRSRRSFSPGSLRITRPGQSHVWSGDLSALIPVPTLTSHLQNMVSQMAGLALTKAYSKIDSSDLKSGEYMSDVGKTLGMLRRPFSSATDLISRMVKYRKSRLGKTARSAAIATSNTWLEYRYGWKPIIMDGNVIIHNARQRCQAHGRKILLARGGEHASSTSNVSFSDLGLTGITSAFRASGTASLVHEVSAGAGVVYALVERTASSASSKFLGTRAVDLPATLWEVMPYSFVVDWFVNVGDWVQARTPNPDVSILGSWVTTVQNKTYSVNGSTLKYYDSAGVPPGWVTGTAGSSITEFTDISRDAHPEVPRAPLVKVNALSLVQSIDAVGLLTNQILGSLKTFKH